MGSGGRLSHVRIDGRLELLLIYLMKHTLLPGRKSDYHSSIDHATASLKHFFKNFQIDQIIIKRSRYLH
jgi:hypothetical protein